MGKKKHEAHPPTAEEQDRRMDLKLKRCVTNAAIEMAKDDDYVKRQMAAKAFGFPIQNPMDKSQSDLRIMINDLAI